MIDYSGKEINYQGCPACAYSRGEFSLPCGIAYETDKFIVSQDWELPIEGFFIISPKKHIEFFDELSKSERDEAFELAEKVINILKSYKVSDRFNVICEEKQGIHFHIWIMPRHKWMEQITDGIIKKIGVIFDYAKENLRTPEQFKKIQEITQLLKKELEFGESYERWNYYKSW